MSNIRILAWHELRQIDVHVLRSSVQALPFSNMLMLQLLALLAVFSMVLYDWQLSRWLSIPLAAPTLLRYSWVANSFNNFIGLSGLAGSGIRFLLLAKQGVATRTASVYSGAIMLAVPVGLAVLALLVLLFGHARVSNLGIPNWLAHLVLLGFAAYAPVFLWLIGRGGLLRRLTRGANPLHLRHGLWLIATSVLDWLLAMAVAWVSLWLSGAHVSIITFVAAFTLAAALGILSLIPGGLGVFDGSLLLLLSASGVANASVLADLPPGVLHRAVVYRVVPGRRPVDDPRRKSAGAPRPALARERFLQCTASAAGRPGFLGRTFARLSHLRQRRGVVDLRSLPDLA